MKRIIINTALQTYRKKDVLSLISEEIPEPIEVEIETEDISLSYLLKIIQELPNRYRMVFNLYVMDGYTHREIAEMLEISEGTSKSNLSRLILKKKVEAYQNQLKKKNEAL